MKLHPEVKELRAKLRQANRDIERLKEELSSQKEWNRKTRKYYYTAFIQKRAERVLNPRERIFLVRANGFESGEPVSFDEIGMDFGVTRERVRQITSKAINKFNDRRRK